LQAMGCAAVLTQAPRYCANVATALGCHMGLTGTPHTQVLLPVPGRSSANGTPPGRTPTPSAEADLIHFLIITSPQPPLLIRPERRIASVCNLRFRFWPKAVGALLAGDGLRSSPQPRHLGIARNIATALGCDMGLTGTPHTQVLLPVPGRSSANGTPPGRTPTPPAEADLIPLLIITSLQPLLLIRTERRIASVRNLRF